MRNSDWSSDVCSSDLFEHHFQPFRATNGGDPEGLFTGYYEPGLRGSLQRRGPYTTPLYLRPPDPVTVDLGKFAEDLAGRRTEERRVGQECARTCRTRWWPYPYKKLKNTATNKT